MSDTASIYSNARGESKDPALVMWTETTWTNLTIQAKNLGLPKLPYFDPKTMLLSKEVNVKLWRQLVSGFAFNLLTSID
jgi:hypothetical protein